VLAKDAHVRSEHGQGGPRGGWVALAAGGWPTRVRRAGWSTRVRWTNEASPGWVPSAADTVPDTVVAKLVSAVHSTAEHCMVAGCAWPGEGRGEMGWSDCYH